MSELQGAFRRAPRPLMGWLFFLVGGFSLFACVALVLLLLKGLSRWANGESVDLMGVAAIGGVLLPFLGQLVAQGAQWMHARSSERRTEIVYGGQGTPPFVQAGPLPPSPDGGPRPGDSS